MGTGEFSIPSLESLVSNSDIELAAVYTQPDKGAGRGQKLTPSPVKRIAQLHALTLLQPETLKNEGVKQQMQALASDVVIVADYGKIIPGDILALPAYGFINVHPSLLPRYRGPTPVPSAILNGEGITGVSIMLLDRGMDSGPVFKQRELGIMDDDTSSTLSARLASAGAEMLIEILPLWMAGKIKPQPQDDSLATYTRVINREDGKIDWNRSAVDLWRQVRAYQPWPGCYTSWRGKNLKISQAKPLTNLKTDRPGKVIALEGTGKIEVCVECAQGVLCMQRLQLEGKKELQAEEFMRGQRDFIGSILL